MSDAKFSLEQFKRAVFDAGGRFSGRVNWWEAIEAALLAQAPAAKAVNPKACQADGCICVGGHNWRCRPCADARCDTAGGKCQVPAPVAIAEAKTCEPWCGQDEDLCEMTEHVCHSGFGAPCACTPECAEAGRPLNPAPVTPSLDDGRCPHGHRDGNCSLCGVPWPPGAGSSLCVCPLPRTGCPDCLHDCVACTTAYNQAAIDRAKAQRDAMPDDSFLRQFHRELAALLAAKPEAKTVNGYPICPCGDVMAYDVGVRPSEWHCQRCDRRAPVDKATPEAPVTPSLDDGRCPHGHRDGNCSLCGVPWPPGLSPSPWLPMGQHPEGKCRRHCGDAHNGGACPLKDEKWIEHEVEPGVRGPRCFCTMYCRARYRAKAVPRDSRPTEQRPNERTEDDDSSEVQVHERYEARGSAATGDREPLRGERAGQRDVVEVDAQRNAVDRNHQPGRAEPVSAGQALPDDVRSSGVTTEARGSDEPPAPVAGQPGVPEGTAPICLACFVVGEHCVASDCGFGAPKYPCSRCGKSTTCLIRVPVEPSRPGTGEAVTASVGWPNGGIAPPAPVNHPGPGRMPAEVASAVYADLPSLYTEVPGKPDEAPLSERMKAEVMKRYLPSQWPALRDLVNEVAALEAKLADERRKRFEAEDLEVELREERDDLRAQLATRDAQIAGLEAEVAEASLNAALDGHIRSRIRQEFDRARESWKAARKFLVEAMLNARKDAKISHDCWVESEHEQQAAVLAERARCKVHVGRINRQWPLDLMAEFPRGSEGSRKFSALYAEIHNAAEGIASGAPAPTGSRK